MQATVTELCWAVHSGLDEYYKLNAYLGKNIINKTYAQAKKFKPPLGILPVTELKEAQYSLCG